MDSAAKMRRRLARLITVSGLLLGLAGAWVGVADGVPFARVLRDARSPWSDIEAGLGELYDFDTDIGAKTPIGVLGPELRGYREIMSVIKYHDDLSRFHGPYKLYAQERSALVEVIATRFRRANVYIGVLHKGLVDGPRVQLPADSDEFDATLIEDAAVLEAWLREYRTTYYVTRAMWLILAAFALQLLATAVPSN